MVGRKKNDEFDRLNYQLQRFDKKVKAWCPICQKLLANTSAKRLRSHRNKCKLGGSQTNSHGNIDGDDEAEQKVFSKTPKFQVINLPAYTNASHSDADVVEEIEVGKREIGDSFEVSGSSRKRPAARNLSSDSSSSDSESDSEPSPKRIASLMMSPDQLRKLTKEKKKKKKRRKREDLSVSEVTEITRALADFIFECNLSFNVVESEVFRTFVKALEEGYVKKIPTRRALSSTLLDDAYQRCIERSACTAESILFVYSCRNFLTKAKSIMCTLSSVEGGSAFVDTQDFKEDTEAGDKLMEIVCEATVKANTLYGTNIYCLMTDNSREMAQLGEAVNVWHCVCSSHVANQLADGLLNADFTEKVVECVREFKTPQLEKRIIANGGRKLELPRDGRCGSTRLTYECLRENLPHMKMIAAEATWQPPRGRHSNWQRATTLLFDETFVQELEANVAVLESIGELLAVCQKRQSSIADSVEAWLTLGEKFPANSPHMAAIFNHHRELVFNKYALAAFVLHPFHDKDSLPQQYASIAHHFLLEELNADGLQQLYDFQHQRGLFRTLYTKGFKQTDGLLFWNLARMDYPVLANMATRLLRIPASAAKIVTAFGQSGDSQRIPVRNRLTPDKTRKLMHILYAAKLNKGRKKDDEDDEEPEDEAEDN
uniref:HAT C-terminal dimerisation domain-containing protein n=1 Tax=Lutzomyia longipalpis TaxID=7200 RepID=A0A7G3AKB1_LUTLO